MYLMSHDHMTGDEQLVTFRGRRRFCMYIQYLHNPEGMASRYDSFATAAVLIVTTAMFNIGKQGTSTWSQLRFMSCIWANRAIVKLWPKHCWRWHTWSKCSEVFLLNTHSQTPDGAFFEYGGTAAYNSFVSISIRDGREISSTDGDFFWCRSLDSGLGFQNKPEVEQLKSVTQKFFVRFQCETTMRHLWLDSWPQNKVLLLTVCLEHAFWVGIFCQHC